jgi:16S rRNA (guanine(966)-N(2))-methyltransferase RsmD
MMRIVGGKAKGRMLKMPGGGKTRPAMSRVKESLFSILACRVEGAAVLDLFAGSGSVGIEALSRGATFAAFVDKSSDCVKVIHENLETLGFAEMSRVYRMDCLGFVRDFSFDRPFDLVFIDPPYLKGLLDPILDAIPRSLCFDERTIFTIERQKKDSLELEKKAFLQLVDERVFGDTVLTIFKRRPEGAASKSE